MWRFIINLIAFSFVIFINYAANAIPLNGQTTGEISNRLEVLITPAGYTFGIWGFIYTVLAIWLIRSFPKSRRHLPLYVKTTPFFVLSCFFNCLWIVLWHYEFFVLTVFVMIGLLVSLIFVYLKAKQTMSTFIDILPFSVYLGWISVATIVNISYTLVYNEWDRLGFSPHFWTFVMLIVATFLAIFFRMKHNDDIYSLVFVWAFIGIGVKNLPAYSSISIAAFVLATFIFVVSIFGNRKEFFIMFIRKT